MPDPAPPSLSDAVPPLRPGGQVHAMRSVVVIPARHASRRFPGKPLVLLRDGQGEGKSLIRRTWEAACRVPGPEAVHVATDDARIRDHCAAFGASVLMTSDRCANGTERCAEAMAQLDPGIDVVVNLQGDAPLTPPWFVSGLLSALAAAPNVLMATPVLRCDDRALTALLEDRRKGRVGGTTAIFDRAGNALYFSKEVLPFAGGRDAGGDPAPVFHHVGIYAYRRAGLAAYRDWPAGPLERAEGLEQLRFLENGCPVRCVEVDPRDRSFWELNNPVDVARIEAILAREGLPDESAPD